MTRPRSCPYCMGTGHVWMIRKFGLRRWWNYRRAYRAGMVIDYAQAFSPDELARIGECFAPAPWEHA